MNVVTLKDIPWREPVPGFRVRFIHARNMTIAYWEIEAGAEMPTHSHMHEQVMNLIEGDFEMTVGDGSRVMTSGDVASIASGEPHGGRAITRCRVLDAFHPVREDYK